MAIQQWWMGGGHFNMKWIDARLRLPNPGAFGESEETKSEGTGSESLMCQNSQNYQNFPNSFDLSVKIAPDLKEK